MNPTNLDDRLAEYRQAFHRFEEVADRQEKCFAALIRQDDPTEAEVHHWQALSLMRESLFWRQWRARQRVRQETGRERP